MSDPAKKVWAKRYKTRKMVSPLDFTTKAYGYLKERSPCSILDIGCGDGRDALFFAKSGLKVIAIDFSQEAVKRVHFADSSIDARVMDILDMDFPDSSFDAVYAHLSLHYFDDKTTNKVFQNIYRMLKSHGYFFVKCKSTSDPLYGKGEEIGKDMYLFEHQRHFFSKKYMQEKLQEFTIIELEETVSTYDGKPSAFIEVVAIKE